MRAVAALEHLKRSDLKSAFRLGKESRKALTREQRYYALYRTKVND